MSFFEKILSGIVIGMLESLGPNTSIFRDPMVTTITPTLSFNNGDYNNSITPMAFTNRSSSALWKVCADGRYSNMYYYYIVSYGTLTILAILLTGLALIAKVQFNN